MVDFTLSSVARSIGDSRYTCLVCVQACVCVCVCVCVSADYLLDGHVLSHHVSDTARFTHHTQLRRQRRRRIDDTDGEEAAASAAGE